MPHARRLIVALLLLMAAAPWTQAQNDTCDPAIKNKADASNPNAYRQRNDRCEGTFFQEVSAAGNLLVASLTGTLSGFKPESVKAIEVEWKAPAGAPLHLRGYSLRR